MLNIIVAVVVVVVSVAIVCLLFDMKPRRWRRRALRRRVPVPETVRIAAARETAERDRKSHESRVGAMDITVPASAPGDEAERSSKREA